MDLAMLARRDDDRPEEISWYEEILAAAPGNALAANNLAFLLAERSASPERAVELARRAVTLAPAKGEFHDTLAFALNAAGRPRDAAKEAERALELAKNDAWVAVRAAEIFRDAGNADRARAAVKTAKARARPDEREKVEARTEAVLRSLD
jgi:tetratricopeptide (TPR) repeat protein